METLTHKMEDDKVSIKKDTESRFTELMLQEKEKFEIKVKYLMSLNETLNKRVDDFSRIEPSLRGEITEKKTMIQAWEDTIKHMDEERS